MRTSIWTLLALCLFACGPKLPPRYVVESDVGSYKFRRYQQVLDVEIGIEGNPAVGHTATYVRGGKTIDVVPVFITVYQDASGLTETVRQSLRAMSGYDFDITKLSGEYVFRMRAAGADHWVLWVSGAHLLKLGAPEGKTEVPEDLLDLYLDKYPSDLDDKGKARKGTASQGPARSSDAQDVPAADPAQQSAP
ncbi:MAG TPA: hypothetical protein VFZ61_13265 [Polyangiales bacterium]